ncbi:origin recognition complex subunit 5 isoform X3 [Dermochelys coriacea]|uniref:origin recognition complex subunit 5 isoform X3 n=1 Tax=Dermochelys coriacea TaxID=27794 RepID=UPI001CA7FA2D|nr:origin recognition complex subunit 5 isoform X3 [Dermochelys coriacea]XP_043353289.1 origin recognition complex subunit 5 isoform X3 [Dermochelys coriacea]
MPNFEHPEYPEATLLHLESMVPCRESQVSSLLSVFGERQHFSFPSIFIYGHTSSGKTYVMQTLLETLELPHVFVNCVECFTSRLLLEEILTQLQNLSSENKHGSHVPCDTFNDFVRLFKQEIITQELQNQTVYIVLDKAEQLREMEANVLPGFLRLQEMTDRNVTVVFLSEIVWELFRPNTGCLEPFTLYFPDYSIEYSADFYAAYINILLGVFYTVCRDLKELRHLAALNFTKYCEPVVRGEANERDTRRLWKNIESHLKKAMQTVYLREISSSQWERIQQDDGEPGHLKGLSAHAHVELPYYSKFLLIAAYLASYNPARTDKRFFLKHHGKIKKTNFLKKHEKTSNHLLGPKPFPLDRLLAILYSIVDNKVAPTANIFSQITSLVTLQLLTLVGHDDKLDGPKYKCTVSLDFIRAIARTVNFDIIKYLYDFL